MASAALEPIEANNEQREVAQRVVFAMNPPDRETPRIAYLVAPTGEQVPLPESLFRVLLQAAMVLARGEEVLVSPVDRLLTSQQSADLLNVSRTFLVRLLDQGKISYCKVGRHRRIKFGDVNQYKIQRAAERRRHLETLVRESEEAGLYDLPLSAGIDSDEATTGGS